MSNGITTFQVGETYQVRSLGDWDCIFSFEVVSRTAKRLTLNWGFDKPEVRGVFERDGVEMCRPFGTFSMCPTIRADRKEA